MILWIMPCTENNPRYTIGNLLSRNFTFVFLALFSFLSAIYALFPTLPVYLERLEFSIREIGIVVGVYGVSSLAFRFVVGGALLRYPEKHIMIAGSLISLSVSSPLSHSGLSGRSSSYGFFRGWPLPQWILRPSRL
jgi:hypothetical protein